MARARVQPMKQAPAQQPLVFIPSGSVLLDLVLGGGWPFGRVSNIVGDKSSGKTLLAIEACANAIQLMRPNNIKYKEAESAFSEDYAHIVGLPQEVHPEGLDTVEKMFTELDGIVDTASDPSLYIVDSLDALSSAAELKRKIGEDTYGLEKQKMMSEGFRKLIRRIEASQLHLMIVSQVRDNIGAVFGEKHKRSGGRALDFYASQVLWLAEIKKEYRTFNKQRRAVGVWVKARAKKNKVGMPFRQAEIYIEFRYGIDDELSMLEWLKETNSPVAREARSLHEDLMNAREDGDRAAVNEIQAFLEEETRLEWDAIEKQLEPKMRKYA